MRKKFLGTIAVTLAAVTSAAALTGCTQTKATDAIITEEDLTNEAAEAAETTVTKTEEIVVAGGEDDSKTDGNAAFSGAEDENIVLYAEISDIKYPPLAEYSYYEETNSFWSKDEDIPIYDGEAHQVGHIKADHKIQAEERTSEGWSRFKNPIDGTGYEYLYVINEYMFVPGISAEEMKAEIIDSIRQLARDETALVFLDAPTDDMKEYSIVLSNNMDNLHGGDMWNAFFSEDSTKLQAQLYKTFYIECVEDEDGEPYIRCKVYCKDRWE